MLPCQSWICLILMGNVTRRGRVLLWSANLTSRFSLEINISMLLGTFTLRSGGIRSTSMGISIEKRGKDFVSTI